MPWNRIVNWTLLIAVYASPASLAQGPQQAPGLRQAQGPQQTQGPRYPGPFQPAGIASGNRSTAAQRNTAQRPASQPPQYLMNSREFEIPVMLDPNGPRPAEVRLYVSKDQGNSWQISARGEAQQGQFGFSAPADGTYWFATRTLQAHEKNAADPPRLAPQLVVVVDTAQPRLSLNADADVDGRVTVDFAVQDPALAADGVRLFYVLDTDQSKWIPLDAQMTRATRDEYGILRNQLDFIPAGEWRQLQIRIDAQDRAGNQSSQSQQIQRPRLAGTPARLASNPALGFTHGTPASTASMTAQPPGQTAGQPHDRGYAMQTPMPSPSIATQPSSATQPTPPTSLPNNAPAAGAYRPAAPATPALRGWSTSPASSRSLQSGSDSQRDSVPTAPSLTGPQPMSTPANASPIPTWSTTNTNNSALPDATPRNNTRQNNIVTSDDSAPSSPVPPSSRMRPMTIETLPSPPGIPDRTRPAQTNADDSTTTDTPPGNTAYTTASDGADSRQTDLLQDPTGSRREVARPAIPDAPPIDESEIRQSRDRRFELHYEVESVGTKGVAAVELWGTRDGGRTWSNWGNDEDLETPFDIETNGSGLYGFRIVVVGNNGLTSPPPRSGDPADIYINVDTEAPYTRINAARYGEATEAGSLIIEYECQDDNMATRPVTLSFAETPSGPWTTIAAGLENTGRYAWQADPRLPRQIYLRIEAVDRAGNVGSEVTSQPIAVQGLAPRGRIRAFQPID